MPFPLMKDDACDCGLCDGHHCECECHLIDLITNKELKEVLGKKALKRFKEMQCKRSNKTFKWTRGKYILALRLVDQRKKEISSCTKFEKLCRMNKRKADDLADTQRALNSGRE